MAYSQAQPELGAAPLAVKWIGNNGSHDSDLGVKDVLLGAEILDLVITALYDNRTDHLYAKVKAINKAKKLPKDSA